MKVLIVEDEERLAKLLKFGLQKQGHVADYLLDGEAGQKRLEIHHNSYNAVVLDLLMPKKSGAEVCQNIRKMGISIPVLILTGKNDLETKVAVLDSGADDYLTKPFSMDEILARLRAITRRPSAALPLELRAGSIVLNPATKKVFACNQEVKLTLKEFRLLEYLIRRSSEVVGREDIIENLWDFNFDSFSNIVDVYVSKLRSKLGKYCNTKVIETAHGIGYRIVS